MNVVLHRGVDINKLPETLRAINKTFICLFNRRIPIITVKRNYLTY